MAEKQTIIIEEIAKVDNVLEGIKKIQQGFNGLTVPKDLQRQFEEIYKKIIQQAEKAKQAASSGFETKGDVKKFTDALRTIANLYNDLETKAGRLEAEKLAFGDAKGLKDFDDHLKELKKDLDNAKQAAADFGDSIKDKVQAGFDKINSYTNKKSVFKEWAEAQDALYNNNDIDGFKKKVQEIGAEFEKLKTQGIDLEKSAVWSGKYKVYQEMVGVLQEYEQEQQNVITKEQEYNDQVKVKQDALNATKSKIKGVTDATKEAAEAAQRTADNERNIVTETQRLNSELEHFKGKAAYFFGMSNAINLFKRSLRSAYSTVKDLDAVMTETAVVTDFSVSDMWSQLPEYTQRANELGVTIHDTYEAATLFYQQGLKTNEVMQISNETLKMARIAGLDAATASDRMTNALRGFNMELDKVSAQRVNDVYSKLAAITASNTDEISTAMTKVASLAHNANMEFETTAAFLAQIIESTRESAETAGTALKTVVARFSEVKKLYTKGELLGQDEEGEEIDVNKVSTALRSAGINLNEYLTGAKGLDDIFIELAEKWDSLDQVQQRYIATMAAGSRQQSRFIALMSDYKRTVQLVEAANNANGASEEQYGKTLESLQTKLARLKNAWNEFILGLANSDVIKGAVDLLTGLITAINNLIKTISGKNSAAKMITTFFTAFTTFKIGAHAIGRNGGLIKFFAGLTGTDATQLATLKGHKLASVFYSSLADAIANPKKFIGNGGFSKEISGIKNYFMPQVDNTFLSDTKGIQAPLSYKLDSSLSTREQYVELWNTIDKGNLTVGELNKALEKSGQEFRITNENAKELGIRIKDTTANMRIASAAAVALGGALMAIGGALEEQEGPMKDFGTIIKALGAGLMTFGTIMSVYLPLQAQLMARGVTSAIVSIPIVGIIAGIIAVLTVLGIAIYNLAKNNSLETKLENATKYAKEAKNAAEEAKDAYEKLGEAWNNLSDKYEVIENATKGTQEWRDAIREVNDAVLELYDTYSDVQFKRDEDGILHILNQDEIDERERTKAANAAAAQRMANINVLETQNEIDYAGITENSQEGEIYKAIIDAKLNSGEIESLIYAADEDIRRLIDEEYAKRGIDWSSETADVEGIRKYAQNYRYSQERIASENLALGSTILNEANIDKDLQSYANNFLNNDYLSNLKGKYTEQINEEFADHDPEKLQEEYAKKRGYANYATYKDYNPDEEISTGQMKDYVVGAKVTEEATKEAESFVNNITTKLNETEKGIFANAEGGALTKDQALKLQKYNDKEIEDIFNKLGGEEVLGPLKDFIANFRNDIQIALGRFELGDFSTEFTNILSESLDNNLSSASYEGFVNNLWSIYSTSGEESAKKIQSSFLRLTNNMNPEEVEGFTKAINSVNWASADSIRTLDELAKEYGISEEAIKAFENQIIDLNNAVAQFDAEKLASALGLANKINSGEQGRSFSKEDYETAINNGADKNDFVYNINTDAYDYIGKDIQDVRTAILQQIDTLRGSLEKQVGSNEAIEKLAENGKLVTNPDNYAQIRAFLTEYQGVAGKDSMISQDFLLTANEDQIRAKYEEIMQQYLQREDTQAKLDQANAYYYQTKTGADLAALANIGDEDAINALKQQIVNSGLSQAIIDALLEDVESGEEEKITAAGGVMDTISASNQYGISTEDLEAYVTALRTVDELQGANEATLYSLALANANYQQGFKSVIESYEEWIELKQEDGSIRAEDGNEEQLKAFDKLKKDLKQMFNLTEDVSDEFFKSAENVELLEAAVNGDTKAVSKLRAELAKTKIDLVINDENVRNQVYALFDDIIDEAGTLEFGASLDMAPAMQALQQLLEASGVTVSDMAKIFESFGWTPEVTEKAIPFTSFQQMRTHGYQEVVDPVTHETVPIPTEGEDHYVQDGMILVPVFGGATFTPPEIPSFSPSTSSSGGGGGGSEKKPSYWKNPYDELYNLQEKINEALRTREALERRYQKLLKQEQATLRDIRKAYYDQITHLSSEADLQKQMAEGRLRQIKQIGEQMYTDSEGDRTSFSDLGVTKYASYNKETGLIQIDWDALEEIANDSDREEEGKAAEAYISKLEELVSSYEEVRDKLWEIEDKIEEIRQAAIDSYLSFEDRVMDAVVDSYQRQIDSYQDMSESLEKANTEIIDSIHEQIDLSRQIRDNTKKEQDIADMENRLAYLQRDTSGGNDLEILKLQKDIDKAREDYTDTLIDQAINDMQKDAERAAEQRSKQIDIMNAQLKLWQDNGLLWEETHALINGAIGKDGTLDYESKLIKYLEETEAYKTLSAIGKEKWREEVAEAFHKAWVGKDEAEDKYDVDANDDKIVNHSGTSDALEHVAETETSTTTREDPFGPYGRHKFDEATEAGVAMNICGPNQGWGNGEERFSKLEEKGLDAGAVQSIVNDIVNSGWDDSYYRKKYGIDDLSDYSYYAFKSGGLADFTGPAWLDGTKTKPEIILSAQDSANFIALRDILASLLNVQGGLNNTQKGGDNYFDIDISANIDSDYDVDKLAERIKKGIYEDGQYRNVNTINYLR